MWLSIPMIHNLLILICAFIVAFNLMLIVLGVAGVIQPTTSALLHNASTLGISLDSMTDLLDKEKECKEPEA